MRSEEYHSPDGALTLVIEHENGDIRIGFAGSEWHMHADLLVGEWGDTPEKALRRYAAAILANDLPLAVLSQGDVIVSIWVSDDPAFDADMARQGQTLRFRLWDGREAPRSPADEATKSVVAD